MHKKPFKDIEYRKVTFCDMDAAPGRVMVPPIIDAPVGANGDHDACTR